MRVAILQPSYIPWRGYFHQIKKVDIFIFYDDVQYDKHGWRNRNKVKTAGGSVWLTVPVHARGNVVEHVPINEVAVASHDWIRKHVATIRQSYSKAPHFKEYMPIYEEIVSRKHELLAPLAIDSTVAIARALGLETRFLRSSELGVPREGRSERLVALLRKVGATHYLSGPSARDYLDEKLLEEAKISLEYMRYDYEEYPQLHGPFDPHVSVLDLLFMVGPRAGEYLENRP